MTASKRYIPVSLVCLLIASTYSATTNPAKAGPSSSLDPYATIQAPTAKELEDKNNKARAKKGLPPIHKDQPTSSTKVEDLSSNTTYVTAPGGGNGKAMKQNSSVAESGASGGKFFGKFPKIGLPSIPSMPVIGKGKSKASEKDAEVKVAKTKEKAPRVVASKPVKETLVGDESEPAAAAKTTTASAKVAKVGESESDGNMVTKTLKATTSGMVNGSKKVGSGIASGAKASGSVLAKGASMVGSGFKATGEKLKGGTGKLAGGMPKMPNPFQKKDKQNSNAGALATSTTVATGGQPNLAGPKKSTVASNQSAQNELLKQSKVAAASSPAKVTPMGDSDELLSESAINAEAKGNKGGIASMSAKMTNTFSKLNPFGKKGIAGKKAEPTL
ncbi:hypothetical protein BH11CYA1_BH11CYA1_35550 [soil metagenome]